MIRPMRNSLLQTVDASLRALSYIAPIGHGANGIRCTVLISKNSRASRLLPGAQCSSCFPLCHHADWSSPTRARRIEFHFVPICKYPLLGFSCSHGLVSRLNTYSFESVLSRHRETATSKACSHLSWAQTIASALPALRLQTLVI